jgi:hypothetical protein
VWGAIYGQDMFKGVNSPDTPPEQRVFYRCGAWRAWLAEWLAEGLAAGCLWAGPALLWRSAAWAPAQLLTPPLLPRLPLLPLLPACSLLSPG